MNKCVICDRDDVIFTLINSKWHKRIHIQGRYFRVSLEIVECDHCGAHQPFTLIRRWRNWNNKS